MVAAVKKVISSDVQRSNEKPGFVSFNAIANAMDNSGAQDIFQLDVEGCDRLSLRFDVAVNALAALTIQGLVNSQDTTFVQLAAAAGDYTGPVYPVLKASAALTTLAVGSGWVILDVRSFSKIKIVANSGAAGGSTLALHGGASLSAGNLS